MSGRRRVSAALAAMALTVGGWSIVAAAPAHAATPIANGDIIASLANGQVNEYTPAGVLVQTLMTATLPAGMAFDGSGNLYVTDFLSNDILKRDAITGTVTVFSNNTILADGTSYNSPESIAFGPGFAKMYVSDANRFGPGGGIHVVNPASGKGTDFFPLPTSSGSDGAGESDWLAFNAAATLFMTNENATQGVMKVNQTTKDIVQPSFVPNLPNTGYALSFDKNGNLWVGVTDRIMEFNSTGALVNTITNPSFSTVFSAVFNPAGDTFYAGDLINGNIYTYDLAGALQGTFNTGSGVDGLAVAGSIVVPGPKVSIGNVGVFEGTAGSRTANFTVSLDQPSTSTVTVHYATSDGSAVAPRDYTPKSGTVTFAPGTTSQTVSIKVNGSTAETPDPLSENFRVTLSAPTGGASLGLHSVGTGAILDEDPSAPGQLDIGRAKVFEGTSGARTATLTVSLSAPSASPVTVSYATANGTATAPTDYTAKSGTLTFAPGSTSQTIAVTVKADSDGAALQVFTVNLSAASGATIVHGTGKGKIADGT